VRSGKRPRGSCSINHLVLEAKQAKATIVVKDEVGDDGEIHIGVHNAANNFSDIGVNHGVEKLDHCNMIKLIFSIEQRINLNGLKRNWIKRARSINPRGNSFKCKSFIKAKRGIIGNICFSQIVLQLDSIRTRDNLKLFSNRWSWNWVMKLFLIKGWKCFLWSNKKRPAIQFGSPRMEPGCTIEPPCEFSPN
jgi:hypothetical protein